MRMFALLCEQRKQMKVTLNIKDRNVERDDFLINSF